MKFFTQSWKRLLRFFKIFTLSWNGTLAMGNSTQFVNKTWILFYNKRNLYVKIINSH